jgi:carbon-monoxide dehydrogenase iron sulfur subunit
MGLVRREELVKVLTFDPTRCTGCHICEETCSKAWFKVIDRAKSAIQILDPEEPGGPYQAITCTQCGDCIDICPTLAIRRGRDGVVRLRKRDCVGCLSCVAFCEIWAMRAHPDCLEPNKCVACGRCAEACPEHALRIDQVADPRASQTERWAERMVRA